MPKFLVLLKYLDQSKITPEAVLEIASILGRDPTLEQAADVANAFKTRGSAGLISLIPAILSWPHKQAEKPAETNCVLIAQCPHCGKVISVNG